MRMACSLGTTASSSESESGSDAFKAAETELRRQVPLRHPRLRECAKLIKLKRFAGAERLLRVYVERHPRDTTALYLTAEAAAGLGNQPGAELLLRKCVHLAPELTPARYVWVFLLLALRRCEVAAAEADELLRREPNNPLFRALKAETLEAIGNYSDASVLWRDLAQQHPSRPESWQRYGNALRTMGRLEDCIAAYRRYVALDPLSGKAWWNLADLKTFRFGSADIEQMEALLKRQDLSATERSYLHFAIGKAFTDLKQFEKAFMHYAKANALHSVTAELNRPKREDLSKYISRCKIVFSEEFFKNHSSSGCPAPDPIFIIGMRRSGSTLIEQVLASHSLVEATRELWDLDTILKVALHADYPANVETLAPPEFQKFGETYLESASACRKTGRPFFTDKMGGNFVHLGLIHLILPHAKIVDVRRHPLACCVSNFIQMFGEGKTHESRLADIGRKYRGYVELMAHFDGVLPGKVHRVIYERLVTQPEQEIRSLLEYLELPFEDSCLQFHRTERAITTVSAEQVRRPLYTDGMDHWRNFEPWLGPLKGMLGPVLDSYPDVPEFGG